VASKVFGVFAQFIALPIAIRALGIDHFAIYAMAMASSAWITLVGLGIGPGLTVSVVAARAAADKRRETQLFASAMLPTLLITGSVLAVLLPIVSAARVTAIFGSQYAPSRYALLHCLQFVILLSAAQILLSVVEATQAGYQEHYRMNLAAMCGSAISVPLIILTGRTAPTAFALLMATQLPAVASRMVNAVIFLRRNKHLRPVTRALDARTSRALLKDGAAFSTVSVGSFVNTSLLTLLVARFTNSATTATFAAAQGIFSLLFGLISMLTVPLSPAVSDSAVKADVPWLRRAYAILLRYSLAYGIAGAAFFAVFGCAALRLWYGKTVAPTQILMNGFGAYFALGVWEHAHHMFLIGLRQISRPSLLFFSRSAVGTMGAALIVRAWGADWVLLSACLLTASTTAVIFHRLVRRELLLLGNTGSPS
jgi:O-antigen/teichoic acid export membrane protein